MEDVQPASGAQPGQRTSGLAIASLITAILMGPVGLILGIIALVQMNKDPSLGGKGLAIAGVIIGGLSLLALVPLIMLGSLAYFGTLSPEKFVPERTVFQAPFPNTDVANTQGNAITIPFNNFAGRDITIVAEGSATGVCANAAVTPSTTEPIMNGDSFTVTWTCNQPLTQGMQIDEEFSFKYMQEGSDLAREHTGQVITTVN